VAVFNVLTSVLLIDSNNKSNPQNRKVTNGRKRTVEKEQKQKIWFAPFEQPV
jgi:hypothetical protein